MWAAVLVVSAAGTVPLLAALHQLGTTATDEVNEDFGQGAVVFPDRLVLVEGFKPGSQGWYLDTGTSGRFVYRIPGQAGKSIGANLWVYTPPGGTTTILAEAEGQPAVVLATNVHYLGDRVNLPPQYASAPYVDLEVRATNPSGPSVLVVDKLVTDYVQGTDPRAPPFFSYLAFGSLVAAIAFAILRRRPHALRIAAGIGVVVAIATAGRMLALFVLNRPLDPDAFGYRTYADRFQWWPLFDNGIFSGNFAEREPLYPMLVHIYFQVLGSSDFHLRVVSATLSIAVVIVSIVAARRRLESWWGPLLVGLLVATSGPLIQESDRGLRLEFETLAVLALYLALDRRPYKRPLVDAIVVGLIGAAMALTRTYFIPVFLAAVAVSFLLRYRPWPRAAALVVVAAVLMGGAEAAHRVGLYIHHQDAFYDTAGYDRWLANTERFSTNRPLPHPELFPTAAQYQQFGPYFGPKISTYQYFFVIHSPAELARDSLPGARLMFDSINSYDYTVRAAGQIRHVPTRLVPLATSIADRADIVVRWMVLLGLLGMLLRSWRDPRLILIPLLVGIWVGLNAFLIDHQLLERYRHTWQVFPLAVIAAVWLAELFVIAASRRAHWTWPRISKQAWSGPAAQARFSLRDLAPLLALVPLGLAVLLAGGRPGLGSLLIVVSMVLVTGAVAVAARSPALRDRLLWLVAAIGPIAGLAYVVAPQAPTLAALTPAGVVVAAYLYFRGQRWALVLGLFDLTVVAFTEPVAVWIGLAVAVIWLATASGRLATARQLAGAVAALAAGLTLVAATASLAATTPPASAGWSSRLAAANSTIDQQVTVDRAGDNAIWLFARRASSFSDYPARLELNDVSLTDDLNSYLPTETLEWVRIPVPQTLQVGDHLDIRITAGGQPNLVDRYVEVGGVYAKAPGLESAEANGTYLIVLGDDSLPLAPGGLPEPLVRNRLQPPLGEWMPGERDAPPASREQASTLDVWRQTLETAARHPFGIGTGELAATLDASGNGFGPGLSARSELLQALAEWGIPGLAGLVIILAAAAGFARRSKDILALALLAMTVMSLLGASLLLDPVGAASVWFVLGVCFGALPFGVYLQGTGDLTNDRDRAKERAHSVGH